MKDLKLNRFNPRAYKAGKTEQQIADVEDIPHLKAGGALNPKLNETITFFLTSERDARISMLTCLVCGSEADLLVSKETEQLKNNPAVEKPF